MLAHVGTVSAMMAAGYVLLNVAMSTQSEWFKVPVPRLASTSCQVSSKDAGIKHLPSDALRQARIFSSGKGA